MSEETSWASIAAEVTLEAKWEPTVQRVCIDGLVGDYRTLGIQLTPKQARALTADLAIALTVAESQGMGEA